MKKISGFLFGGLKKKTLFLVLGMLLITVVIVAFASAYQNRMLISIVGETRVEQQKAISQTSEETMHQVIAGTLVNSTALQARIADNDFAEIVNDTYMLQTMAQGLIERRNSLSPAELALPDPSLDGIPSAMVLSEEGVDYTLSEYLPAVGHMGSSMLAMVRNSDKIAGCFIGLADGTHFGVDDHSANRFDENGELIPFPVRERPWYRGAVETGGLYFTSASSAGFACIVNDHGQVIIAPEKMPFFEITTADRARDLRETDNEELSRFITNALAEPTELTLLNIGGRDFYVAGSPMPTVGWTVISLVDKEVTEQPEKMMLAEYDRINDEASGKFRDGTDKAIKSGQLVFILIVLVGTCAALLVSGRIARPLEEMTENIRDSSRTGRLFEMKDSYRTNDEIEVLAEAFDDLSKKTRQYIEDITEITREKERVSTELSMAQQIQSSMLPHIFPAFPNRSEFDIYASMDPAKEVGGDFYDFFLIDNDHLCMVMADVSGKGVPAALFMMVSKAILKTNALAGKSPREILTTANETICSNNKMQMFVTVWLGILEISTGRITAANAGHEYPALARGGDFALLRDKHGLVIGAMEGVEYKEYEIDFKPGDRLFLYTDGVPEATDAEGRLFGTQRMLDALNAARDAGAQEILGGVKKAVDGFVGASEQFDDLTMLCIEYRGPGADAEKQ